MHIFRQKIVCQKLLPQKWTSHLIIANSYSPGCNIILNQIVSGTIWNINLFELFAQRHHIEWDSAPILFKPVQTKRPCRSTIFSDCFSGIFFHMDTGLCILHDEMSSSFIFWKQKNIVPKGVPHRLKLIINSKWQVPIAHKIYYYRNE